jgi:hypothetical protein
MSMPIINTHVKRNIMYPKAYMLPGISFTVFHMSFIDSHNEVITLIYVGNLLKYSFLFKRKTATCYQ